MATKTAKKTTEAEKENLEAKSIALMCRDAALDKKASEVVILKLTPLSSFTDYFVICSAPSERQVQAIVRNVEDVLRKSGRKPLGSEGMDTSSWILLDLGDVVFHCFTDSAREYYDLEGFWIDAEHIES